jgi:pyrroline-5-carboxylate reductase
MSDVKYPEIEVQLTGGSGNAFAVLGAVKKALIKNGVSREEADQFFQEATAGDYDHLLQTCMKWVSVN